MHVSNVVFSALHLPLPQVYPYNTHNLDYPGPILDLQVLQITECVCTVASLYSSSRCNIYFKYIYAMIISLSVQYTVLRYKLLDGNGSVATVDYSSSASVL